MTATDDHGFDVRCDDDGWWHAHCDCGWTSEPCPGRGEAADEWADHIRDEATQ